MFGVLDQTAQTDPSNICFYQLLEAEVDIMKETKKYKIKSSRTGFYDKN